MGAKNSKEEDKATEPAKTKSSEATIKRDPKPVKGVANHKVIIVHEGSDQPLWCIYSHNV